MKDVDDVMLKIFTNSIHEIIIYTCQKHFFSCSDPDWSVPNRAACNEKNTHKSTVLTTTAASACILTWFTYTQMPDYSLDYSYPCMSYYQGHRECSKVHIQIGFDHYSSTNLLFAICKYEYTLNKYVFGVIFRSISIRESIQVIIQK